MTEDHFKPDAALFPLMPPEMAREYAKTDDRHLWRDVYQQRPTPRGARLVGLGRESTIRPGFYEDDIE
jgi:hypothetical protein